MPKKRTFISDSDLVTSVKHRAYELEVSDGVDHSQALDFAAQERGFKNWTALTRHECKHGRQSAAAHARPLANRVEPPYSRLVLGSSTSFTSKMGAVFGLDVTPVRLPVGATLVFGPTRSGWTSRFVIPNLMAQPIPDHTMIIVDPLGEAYAATQAFREVSGRRVILIGDHTVDRYHPSQRKPGPAIRWSINPLDILASDKCNDLLRFQAVVNEIAEALTPACPWPLPDDVEREAMKEFLFGVFRGLVAWVADAKQHVDGTTIRAGNRDLDLAADVFHRATTEGEPLLGGLAQTASIRDFSHAGGNTEWFTPLLDIAGRTQNSRGSIRKFHDAAVSIVARVFRQQHSMAMNRTGYAVGVVDQDGIFHEKQFEPVPLEKIFDGSSDLFLAYHPERENQQMRQLLVRTMFRLAWTYGPSHRSPDGKATILIDAAHTSLGSHIANLPLLCSARGINIVARCQTAGQLKEVLGREEFRHITSQSAAIVHLLADWPDGNNEFGRICIRGWGVERFRKPAPSPMMEVNRAAA